MKMNTQFNKTHKYLFLSIIILFVTSCSKSDNGSDNVTDNSVVNNFSDANKIYIAAGSFRWENGKSTELTSDLSGIPNNGICEGYSIFGLGSDIYIPGRKNTASDNRSLPAYWKNGIPNSLTIFSNTTYGVAKSIFVEGNDVYVAGTLSYKSNQISNADAEMATIWKNNVSTKLSNSLISRATSVFVSGTDIYVCGQEWNGSSGMVPTFWKNGTISRLSSAVGEANQIVVSGSDVYVVGWVSINNLFVPKLWKNGIDIPLGIERGIVTSILCSGSNLFVTGGEVSIDNKWIPFIWKNGQITRFTESKAERANSIFAIDSDLYVLTDGELWKNLKIIPTSGFSINSTTSRNCLYVKH
jgi:hypothetical protein